jgi:hypothetical protein
MRRAAEWRRHGKPTHRRGNDAISFLAWAMSKFKGNALAVPEPIEARDIEKPSANLLTLTPAKKRGR